MNLMRSNLSAKRYEIKIPLQRLQLQELRAAFLGIGVQATETFPDRIVHSVYFDTVDLDDYQDNTAGINQRSKTRIRWYNSNSKNLTLEIKRKRNKVSDKITLKLKNPSGVPIRIHHDLHALIESNEITNSSVIPILYALFPFMEVEYDRSYYEIGLGIRMTIDLKMRFRKLYPLTSKYWTRSPVDAVVEFKFSPQHQSEFSELMRNLPFRIFRHSKYLIGTDCVCIG